MNLSRERILMNIRSYSRRRLMCTACLLMSLLLWLLWSPAPAQAVPTCGGQTTTAACGKSNFCYCCDGTCANCVWWAWEAACRNWKFAFATCNDAHRWNEQAKSRGEPTGSTPRDGSVFVCEQSSTCSNWGHVGWVVTAQANGSFSATEQSCGGACTTANKTRSAGFATGGFIYNPNGGNPPPPTGCTSDAQCTDPAKPKCSSGNCVAAPSSGCSYVKVSGTGGIGLKIRSSSNTQSSQIGSAPEGACLAVLSKTTSGESVSGNTTWYNINYNGTVGWVSGAFASCSDCGGPPVPVDCQDGQTKSCYSGPSGTAGKGICKTGTQTCAGGKWGSCVGEVTPQSESCGNNKDDDCNGQVDETCPPPGCQDGQTKPCYTGPEGTAGKGICREGTQTCAGGKWGGCVGEVTPQSEVCGNNKDDNCDGRVDDGCVPPGTDCKDKDGDGFKEGLACTGALDCDDNDPKVSPGAPEICGNNKDDNCDGRIDENCPVSACQDGQSRPCYTGPANTNGVGVCRGGTQTCQKNAWTVCAGQVVPAAQEICNNNQDDNCNGQIDEGCAPLPSGCVDKDGDGFGVGKDCPGAIDCNDDDKTIYPGALEICGNNKDDNCDGRIDEDCNAPSTKKTLGDEGCTGPHDCDTNFCVRVGDIYRCSKPCKGTGDCPANYSCVENTACWPDPPSSGKPSGTLLCSSDAVCPTGQRCVQGVCSNNNSPAKGCGCSASSEDPTWPMSFAWLWLLVAAFLFASRRRPRL